MYHHIGQALDFSIWNDCSRFLLSSTEKRISIINTKPQPSFKSLVRNLAIGPETLKGEEEEQAGAELCQAHTSLG